MLPGVKPDPAAQNRVQAAPSGGTGGTPPVSALVHSTKLSPHPGLDPRSFTYDVPGDQCRTPPIELGEAIFRHSGWATRRLRTWEALKSLRVSRTRLDRFANCGSSCHVEYSPSTKRYRPRAHYCRDRLCQPCGLAKSATVTRNVTRHCAGRDVRFYTFTLRHSPTSLSDQIDRLYRHFLAFRRRQRARARITGGVAILEVTKGRDLQWHPHLHCIIEGSYYPQQELSSDWLAVTGDSYIVHVKPIAADGREVRYACAYAGKPLDASCCGSPGEIAEVAAGIRGRRICFTFGSWRGLDLDAPDPDAPDDWVTLGRLSELLADARRGDRAATEVLNLLLHPTIDEQNDAQPPPDASEQ